MHRNHTTMIGPNRVATLAVPRAWAKNSMTSTTPLAISTVPPLTM